MIPSITGLAGSWKINCHFFDASNMLIQIKKIIKKINGSLYLVKLWVYQKASNCLLLKKLDKVRYAERLRLVIELCSTKFRTPKSPKKKFNPLEDQLV